MHKYIIQILTAADKEDFHPLFDDVGWGGRKPIFNELLQITTKIAFILTLSTGFAQDLVI